MTGRQIFFEENKVEAESGTAAGGVIYTPGSVEIHATEGLLFKNNSAHSQGGAVRGGAIWAVGNVNITMGDENTIGDAVFNGNFARGKDGFNYSGAIYTREGAITLTRASDLGAVFDFATPTDDVFAKSGSISITGMLIAKPGVSFAAGSSFSFGDGSSLTVQGFNSRDDVKMSEMALFGAAEINFNRAKLTLTDYDKLVPVPDPANPQSSRHYKIDVVSVLLNGNTADHVLNGAASADITNEDWALDISDYPRGKLWLSTAVKPDADSELVSNELNLTQNAKLVLEFDRHSLIWNGKKGDQWEEADDSKQVWHMAKEDSIFERELDQNGAPISDSFWRGDIVVFDDQAEEKNVKIAGSHSGDPLHPDHEPTPNVSAGEVWVIGGQYTFTSAHENAHLRTDTLAVSNDTTEAHFKLPVRVFESADLGPGTTTDFTSLVTLVNTPVNIAGQTTVNRPVEGAYTVRSGGTLTLENGSGILHSLELENSAAFNLNALNSYGVIDHFTAKNGSHTLITPQDIWTPDTADYALTGEGEAVARIEKGAALTIAQIEKGATGAWKLLHDFAQIDGQGWNSIENKTLAVLGYSGLIASGDQEENSSETQYVYQVKTDKNNTDYILQIAKIDPKEEEPDTPSETPESDDVTPPPPTQSEDVTPTPPTQSEDVTPTPPEQPEQPEQNDPLPQPVNTVVPRTAAIVQHHVSRAVDHQLTRTVADVTARPGIPHAIEVQPDKQLWAHAWRTASRLYDTADTLEHKTRAYGLVIGRDLRRDPKKTLGLAIHIGKGDSSGKGIRDGETAKMDFYGALIYGRRETDKWLLTGDAGITWYKTDYTQQSGATADNAKSSQLSVGGRAYYKWIENPQPGQISARPFAGLRWNRYRASAYETTSGMESGAWTADQLLIPMGIRIEWGEMESKDGWHVKPSLEFSYLRTVGDRSVRNSIRAKGTNAPGILSPIADRDSFAGEFRYEARRKNFTWSLNAGFRRSTSEKDLNVGTTLRWDL